VYGAIGVTSPTTRIGGRRTAGMAVSARGDVYVLAGYGWDTAGVMGPRADFWLQNGNVPRQGNIDLVLIPISAGTNSCGVQRCDPRSICIEVKKTGVCVGVRHPLHRRSTRVISAPNGCFQDRLLCRWEPVTSKAPIWFANEVFFAVDSNLEMYTLAGAQQHNWWPDRAIFSSSISYRHHPGHVRRILGRRSATILLFELSGVFVATLRCKTFVCSIRSSRTTAPLMSFGARSVLDPVQTSASPSLSARRAFSVRQSYSLRCVSSSMAELCCFSGCYPTTDLTNLLSYAAPVFEAGTLFYTSNPSIASRDLGAFNSLPQLVSFDVKNIFNDSRLISVFYGPVSVPQQYKCTLDFTRMTSNLLTCLTQSNSQARAQLSSVNRFASCCAVSSTPQGLGLRFTVVQAGISVTGTDTLNFPTVGPVITGVFGCPTQAGNATSACPTAGQVPVAYSSGQCVLHPVIALALVRLC
jgi:hypothetical protein